jgi:hypothetical protein
MVALLETKNVAATNIPDQRYNITGSVARVFEEANNIVLTEM